MENSSPRAAMRAVRAALAGAGCPDADYDARELYKMAVGQDSRLADPTALLSAARAKTLASMTDRRAAREPLQYIAGQWDFLDFTLAVGPGVLCPRPDTETVCEAALRCLAGVSAPRVLDLCAGTGCLGLGVKRFCPDAQVTCVEKSGEALCYLQKNAAEALPGFTLAHPAVTVLQADVFALWRTLPANACDLIVSNPPYLTGTEMAALMPEVAHEPAMALDGGADGLAFYRLLTEKYKSCLRPGGYLAVEIGCAQGAAVSALGRAAGWREITCRRDCGGNDRVVLLRAPADS